MINAWKPALERIQIFLDSVLTLSTRRISAKTLVLVRLDAIGDFVLWLDTAKEIRHAYPGNKITLVANRVWAEMAQGLPYWDDVWPVEPRLFTRNLLYRWKLLRRVRRAGFEVAIQPIISPVLMHGDSIIRVSGARHRIGSQGDLSNISARNKAISDRWYTRLLPASPKLMMELERNAEFIGHLTGQSFNASLPVLPVLTALPSALKPVSDYFIVVPGASWHSKQWPVACFSRVMEMLQQHYGWQAVLCGSPAELTLCTDLAKSTNASCVNFAGQTSLLELTELIRGAHLLVGNDTSAIHIAAAVCTPAVCILGGGHYGRFMPYPDHVAGVKPVSAVHEMPCFNCNWHCCYPRQTGDPVKCIQDISVDKVWDAVDLVLNGKQ